MFDFINPSNIFRLIEKFIIFINSIFYILLIVALTFALILSPPDYLQGDSVRIMYVHVPSAWIALASFSFIAILSVLNFIFKTKNFNLISKCVAPIGLLFTSLAIITGSLWAANVGNLVGLGRQDNFNVIFNDILCSFYHGS